MLNLQAGNPMTNKPVQSLSIDIRNLTRRFADVVAVDDATLAVEQGEKRRDLRIRSAPTARVKAR
jgi:hypothetical protein